LVTITCSGTMIFRDIFSGNRNLGALRCNG
jgi:hypothetical protein